MHKIIIAVLLSLTATGAYAQPDWNLKRDEDGIKVYTASTPNSDFKSIKVESTVNATLPQLVSFLLDIDKQKDWVFNTRSTRLLKKVAPNEFIFYAEVSVPWPCTNRDYIAHFKIIQTAPGTLSVDSQGEPDYLPAAAGFVRVKHSVAHWDITTISAAQLRVVYTVQFDPSGSVPAWLTNMFVTKGPFETFENLRKGVAGPQYQHAQVDFIK
jgi:hypothetical protein